MKIYHFYPTVFSLHAPHESLEELTDWCMQNRSEWLLAKGLTQNGIEVISEPRFSVINVPDFLAQMLEPRSLDATPKPSNRFLKYLPRVVFPRIGGYLHLLKILQEKPDVFLTLNQPLLDAGMIRALKQKGIFTINWCGEFPSHLKGTPLFAPLKEFDLIIGSGGLAQNLRDNDIYVNFEQVYAWFNEDWLDLQIPQPANKRILFCGGVGGHHHQERIPYIKALAHAFPDSFSWYGYDPNDLCKRDPVIGKCFKGFLYAPEIPKVIGEHQIIINLFLDDVEDASAAINQRALEAAALGRCQFVKPGPAFSDFFEDQKHAVYFDSEQDLVEKVHDYANRPEVLIQYGRQAKERLKELKLSHRDCARKLVGLIEKHSMAREAAYKN